LKLENITVTPHIGTLTYETRNQMEEKALNNLCKYIS
jgi:lactate dehydrogenase-like 2-hydroxyacid dehydrogenase